MGSSNRYRPFRGRRLVTSVAVAVIAVCFVALGIWQVDRWGQRRAANALILTRLEQPPLRLDGNLLDLSGADLRRGVVQGTYDYDHEIVLRNQTYHDLPGVDLLTPLHIEGSDAAVLVNRGWIPFEVSNPAQRTGFRTETGPVEVRGIIHSTQTRPSRFAPADPTPAPGQAGLDDWLRVDIARIQQQVPYPLLPVFLEEEAGPPAAAQSYPRPGPEISLSEGSHLLFAGQWFAFAALLVGIYVTRVRRRAR
jgi:surfeit locus 1 family protein